MKKKKKKKKAGALVEVLVKGWTRGVLDGCARLLVEDGMGWGGG